MDFHGPYLCVCGIRVVGVADMGEADAQCGIVNATKS